MDKQVSLQEMDIISLAKLQGSLYQQFLRLQNDLIIVNQEIDRRGESAKNGARNANSEPSE